jgi:hypothetical protein
MLKLLRVSQLVMRNSYNLNNHHNLCKIMTKRMLMKLLLVLEP